MFFEGRMLPSLRTWRGRANGKNIKALIWWKHDLQIKKGKQKFLLSKPIKLFPTF